MESCKTEAPKEANVPQEQNKNTNSDNVPKDTENPKVTHMETKMDTGEKKRISDDVIAKAVVPVVRGFTMTGRIRTARQHARPVSLDDGRDWVLLYKFLSQKPDVAVLGKLSIELTIFLYLSTCILGCSYYVCLEMVKLSDIVICV